MFQYKTAVYLQISNRPFKVGGKSVSPLLIDLAKVQCTRQEMTMESDVVRMDVLGSTPESPHSFPTPFIAAACQSMTEVYATISIVSLPKPHTTADTQPLY